jgi:hypothetical protein
MAGLVVRYQSRTEEGTVAVMERQDSRSPLFVDVETPLGVAGAFFNRELYAILAKYPFDVQVAAFS